MLELVTVIRCKIAAYGLHLTPVLFGAAGALIAGCTPKPERPARAPGADSVGGPVEIVAARTSYRAGDPIELTVTNHSGDTLAFNPCTRILEREKNGGWEVLEEPGRVCTMEAWILGPGEVRAGRTELPPRMPPGRYRVALGFTVEGRAGGARLTARSAPVTVQL